MRALKFISSARTWLAFGFLFGLALPVAPPLNEAASQSKPRYSVEIRRTSHGIPHITAKDMGSLGFGEGYAFAQDHLCSLRTRMNVLLLDDLRPDGPAGKDGKFTLDELAAAALSNRSLSAELARGELVERCQAAPSVTLDGQAVDLRQACRILAAWDGRYDADSVGPVLWREFITQYEPAELQKDGALFQRAFDPADPAGTPNTLAPDKPGEPQSLLKLARAERLLAQAGVALDTPFGKAQFSDRGGRRIPIHGGEGGYEGITNVANYALNGTTLEPGHAYERVNGTPGIYCVRRTRCLAEQRKPFAADCRS
jgi:acyl-homoserine lactone acylase PvdQ